MLGVALLFIGGVLMVNGVGMKGAIAPRDSAPFNLLVGILVFFGNAVGLLRATDNVDFFLAAGGFLFAFTYLYLSVVQWHGLPGVGIGWYSLFVAINAVVYTVVATDWRLAAMWLMWASLWLCFFLSFYFLFPYVHSAQICSVIFGHFVRCRTHPTKRNGIFSFCTGF